MATQTDNSLREAAEFGLFFLFIALNLVWFALRNISIAVDEYVLFEVLETVRRAGYFIGLAAVLFGLPLIVMLIALNVLWAVVLTICIRRMIDARRAGRPIGGTSRRILRSFVRANRAELVRSGTYAASEIYTYNYPYLIIPMLFGLGAPPIILDTDVQGVPRRLGHLRRGLRYPGAAPDQRAWPNATARRWCGRRVLAAALCALPAGIVSAILLVGADRIFAILLGNAATMPPATTPILIALLFADLTKMVTHSVLVHNGYFKAVARIGMGVVVAMTGVGAFAIATHLDIVHFLEAYAAVYACGAVAAVVMMVRGPFRLALSGRANGAGGAR